MRYRSVAAGTAALVALALAAAADETTFCNFYITSVPYTVSMQGHYCLTTNLSTNMTTGNAITVNSDFVVVDLNNFKLGGGAGGLATNAIGIFANNHRNITVRNGNIRGFSTGIFIVGTTSASNGHLIENNLLDGNTHQAIEVLAGSVVIRNNVINNTGGSTSSLDYHYGIATSAGYSAVVRDNVVNNTFNAGPGSGASGIGQQVVTDHNLVNMGGVSYGFSTGIAGGICRDNTVLHATSGLAYPGCALVGHNDGGP